MIKFMVCGLIALCSTISYSADEYTVKLQDGNIQVPKKLLNQFSSIKDYFKLTDKTTEINFSVMRYSVDSFNLAMKIANIINTNYATKTGNILPEKLSFAVKSNISHELKKSSLRDAILCANFYAQWAPQSIVQFFNRESVKLLKNFASREEKQEVDLSDIDFSNQGSEFKKEVINLLATSDEIIDFSRGKVRKIELSDTKENEVLYEVMTPHGTLYSYIIDREQVGDAECYVLNLSNETGTYVSLEHIALSLRPLYASPFGNKIAFVKHLMSPVERFSRNHITLFSDSGTFESLLPDWNDYAVSKDGKYFLFTQAIRNRAQIKDFRYYIGLYNLSSKEIKKYPLDVGVLCCFNPQDPDTFLYYSTEQVCVTDASSFYEPYGAYKPIVLEGFDGKVIKVTFTDDGSCIFIVTQQGNRLLCYRFSYLERTGKLELSYRNKKIEIINLVNSPDNEQLFVECHYKSGMQAPYKSTNYDLLKFDFSINNSKATVLEYGEEQSFDVRSDGNLVTYKTKKAIHFYDCFFRKEIHGFGIDRCRALLGFSADGLLWLRMESAPDSKIMSRKSAEDYLISYTVKKKEFEDIKQKVTNDTTFDFSAWLDLLTTHDIDRSSWYEQAYDLLMKNKLLGKELEAKIKQEIAKLQARRLQYDIAQTKKELLPQTTTSSVPLTTTTVPQSLVTSAQTIPAPVQNVQPAVQPQPPSQPTVAQAIIQPTPQPAQSFIQQAWSVAKTAGQALFSFVTAPLRWLGFM